MGNLREVNLELGMPTVSQALRRLEMELSGSKKQHCAALKLIHGYGSSGTGGKIRVAVRRRLTELKGQGTIRDFIPGERFTIFEESTLAAFRQCGNLRQDPDLERYNNGVTFVLF